MKKHPRLIFTALLLVIIGLMGGLLLGGSNTAVAVTEEGLDFVPEQTVDQDVVVRVYFDNRAALDAIAGELDIWEVHHDEGYFVAMMSPSQRDWLNVLGYTVAIDVEKTVGTMAPLDPRYHYFDDDYNNSNGNYMVNFIQSIDAMYPHLTEIIDIGNAWQGENGGYNRDLLVLRISNENPAYGAIEDKPPFFLLANIHAREVTTPEMAIRYIKYLTMGYEDLGGYNTDPDVTWLVNHHVIYVLVSANPDGHRVNEADIDAYRRKNMNNTLCSLGDFGIDLNRNHSFMWAFDNSGSSGNSCSETYRGPSPASEPETQAFQNYFATLFTDYNGNNDDDVVPPAAPEDAMGIFISLHTYSDLVLWPWGWTASASENGAQLTTIGRKFAYFNNYTPYQANDLYDVNGSTDDWTYGKFGIASFTFEIGPQSGICGDFFPSYNCQDGINGAPEDFWAENRPAFLYAHKIARTPYITAYGPDTQDLAVSSSPVNIGDSFTLTANVTDHRYGGDALYPINAAEYFIDAPGADGTGIPMNPVDGSWGSTSENVQAIIAIPYDFPLGRHYILVHGRNDQTNMPDKWGPYTAIFFSVTQPQYGVNLSTPQDSGSADPGQVVTYTLEVQNYGFILDTYAIQLESAWPITSTATTIGPLSSGASAAFEVHVSVPITAQNSDVDIAVVTAASQASSGAQSTLNLTTTPNPLGPDVLPESLAQSGDPGAAVLYALAVTNVGSLTDTFALTVENATWPVQAPADTGPVGAGETITVEVSVMVPLEALPGASDLAQIIFTTASPSGQQDSATLETSANAVYAPGTQPNVAVDVPPSHAWGSVVTFTVSLTNTGNITDTYDASVESDWQVEMVSTVGPLAPGESAPVTIVLHVPVGSFSGEVDAAVVTFTSQGNPDHQAQVTLSIIAQWYSNYLPMSIRN